MSQFMDDWGRPLILWALMGLIAFFALRATGAWDAITEKADNAVSQKQFDRLEETVESLEHSVSQIERLRNDIGQLTNQIAQFNDSTRQLALTRQTVEQNTAEIARLRHRGGYMWDSVNRICERLDMICATRNADWNINPSLLEPLILSGGQNPNPKPPYPQYELRAVLPKRLTAVFGSA